MDPFTATVLGMVAIAGGLFVLKMFHILLQHITKKQEMNNVQDKMS